MKKLRMRLRPSILAGVAILATACSTPAPPAPSSAAGGPPSRGTLGMEAGPISRALRRKLSLPESARGAVVSEVFPGGPAALAGIRPGDVVERIGDTGIGNSCDFEDAAHGRPIAPVSVVLRRGGKAIEVKLAPAAEKQFFDESCRLGSAAGCYRKARATVGAGREALYASACDAGSAAACAEAGLGFVRSASRVEEGIALLERSCGLGSGAGCAHEAFFYATGKAVARDDRRAAGLYARGCDLGDARACYNVGLMAQEGRGVPRSAATAVAKYREACDAGSTTACTNLGFFYEHGQGVRKDPARAVALYQDGCDGSRCQPSNLTGCVNVGRAYRDGIGVAKDRARAEQTFRDACDRQPDPDDTDAETNRARACSLLGALYVGEDAARAARFSELGCEMGDSFGCFNASAIYAGGGPGVDADPVRAAEYLEKACRAGDGEGCFDLAIAYEKGNGVEADRAKADAAFQKACALGFRKACRRKAR